MYSNRYSNSYDEAVAIINRMSRDVRRKQSGGYQRCPYCGQLQYWDSFNECYRCPSPDCGMRSY